MFVHIAYFKHTKTGFKLNMCLYENCDGWNVI